MANMSYCRFRNTLLDLEDCYDNITDRDMGDDEERARKRLIELCQQISEEYSDYDFKAAAIREDEDEEDE